MQPATRFCQRAAGKLLEAGAATSVGGIPSDQLPLYAVVTFPSGVNPQPCPVGLVACLLPKRRGSGDFLSQGRGAACDPVLEFWRTKSAKRLVSAGLVSPGRRHSGHPRTSSHMFGNRVNQDLPRFFGPCFRVDDYPGAFLCQRRGRGEDVKGLVVGLEDSGRRTGRARARNSTVSSAVWSSNPR